jgi:hypothetical protein
VLVAGDGQAKQLCLPERGNPRDLYPGAKLLGILDATWKDGNPTLAALIVPPGAPRAAVDGDLVLLAPGVPPRRLAKGVRTARFSPGGDALLFQTAKRQHVGGGAVVAVGSSHLLELASGEIVDLGETVDALWEADGQHVRATRMTSAIEDRRSHTSVRWTSMRIRWDRESRTATTLGRGSAQIPAPRGAAVAWSEDEATALAPSHCAVRLGMGGGPQHPIAGPFCMGIADDRGVRWSPDGLWLAFPRPGPLPGEDPPGSFFIDVVGIWGGRHPAWSALLAEADRKQAAIADQPGTASMDWSPSQRFLALQDAAGDLRVYDLESHAISWLGKGESPRWSPGGGYLLISQPTRAPTSPAGAAAQGHPTNVPVHAVVLPGGTRAASIDLGPVRDSRWLPAAACGATQGP